MEQEMKIKNALYNYYAISRFEMEKFEDEDSPNYLTNYHAEVVIKALLNNCFGPFLYQEAILLLESLDKVYPGALEQNKIPYQNLKDALVLFDAKMLRKEDPIEETMKILLSYLSYYKAYEKKDDEEILKHRYDIMLEELKKDEYYASLLIKMNIIIANNIYELSKKLREIHKNNIVSDSLDIIRSTYYSSLLAILFKDEKSYQIAKDYLVDYLTSLMGLYDRYQDNDQAVNALGVYADIRFSSKHGLKLPNNQDENLEEEMGFLKDKGTPFDKEAFIYCYTNKMIDDIDIFVVNELLLKLVEKLNLRYDGVFEEIKNVLSITIQDLNTLLKEIEG